MRAIIIALLIFEALVYFFKPAPFILPPPSQIFQVLFEHRNDLAYHGAYTALEMVLGFVFGALLGCALAVLLSFSPRLEKRLNPFLILTQSLPVFAIAPLLVIWFGFGLPSKIIMAVIIIFLPLTFAFLTGLKSPSPALQELSRFYKMDKFTHFKMIALPASLPHLFTGLKIAGSLAPIAAIVGEWVGSAKGLGFLMLHANARMQTDQLFAALFVLFALALTFNALLTLAFKRFKPY